RQKDSCRDTCNIWGVLGSFGSLLAPAINRHPAHSLCSGLCCYRIGLVFEARLRAVSAAFALPIKPVLALAQFLASAFLDVDAADCGEAQSLPLRVGHAQELGQLVSLNMSPGDRRLFGDSRSLCFGDPAAHPLGGLHERPNRVSGFGVVPSPSNKPLGKVLGLGSADV